MRRISASVERVVNRRATPLARTSITPLIPPIRDIIRSVIFVAVYSAYICPSFRWPSSAVVQWQKWLKEGTVDKIYLALRMRRPR